jgi:alanine racemase
VLRSQVTIDLGAVRANVRALQHVLGGAELWAVVKADAYGHGALAVSRTALDEGARALCVATVEEALELRAELPDARILVMGPANGDAVRSAREARLELAVGRPPIPQGVPVHVKLDTGMGRWGFAELPAPLPPNVVGLMSHLASADCDEAFTEAQIQRFLDATAGLTHLTRHLANSAGALRFPAARLDAARCGIALYGLSPFGEDPAADGLEPVLSWRSSLAQVKLLAPGESTGYGRRFVASEPTWVGLVPVGYADGFRRDLTGTRVLVDGEPCSVVGTISMDAFAVVLPEERPAGTPVTIVGDGLLLEEHARVAGTLTYELACHVADAPARARRALRS